ncbi:MBL fold metallo-hydrolase [Nocardioides jishulii]|uniref:MBL fold metallo-hydrolase n=1 Tax=Nocardioides jishulii TaxID=2575440 RepID=A0A4V5TJP8_9ACTN|nr:MBL fold metallo-hydrolase [Nocardioides jishulii]TKI60453.1 MBL fold metallo-hydrolase [Nocardioides jishulii]
MRARLGRPDLARWAHLADVPVAESDSPLRVAWLGVSTIHVADGRSALLTDGFFTRPSLLKVGLGSFAPDPARIDEALLLADIDRLDAVLPVHTHYDHVMDSATVAMRTGAVVVGGSSAAQVARGHGVPESRIVAATPGEPLRLGAFEVTLVEGSHCPPDRYPGRIEAPVPRRAGVRAYRCGEAWSTLVRHLPSGRRMLIQGSAGCVPGALEGHRAEVAYLGVGQLGIQDEAYTQTYWDETVGRVGAKRVVVVHHDDFFSPLTAPMRALPYAGDDLGVTMERLGRYAERDGVRLSFPTLWQRSDPWA